jgi:hypothetical protein
MNIYNTKDPLNIHKECTKIAKSYWIQVGFSAWKTALILLFFFAFIWSIQAQKRNKDFRLHIKKTNLPIVIDGIINEDAWKDTDVANNFFMVLPEDTGKAKELSKIRMTYDDKNIYLAATFYNSTSGPYYVESLRRDFSFGKNDNFLFFIDPFNNQTTGFSFGANAAGAQWDGTMLQAAKLI